MSISKTQRSPGKKTRLAPTKWWLCSLSTQKKKWVTLDESNHSFRRAKTWSFSKKLPRKTNGVLGTWKKKHEKEAHLHQTSIFSFHVRFRESDRNVQQKVFGTFYAECLSCVNSWDEFTPKKICWKLDQQGRPQIVSGWVLSHPHLWAILAIWKVNNPT